VHTVVQVRNASLQTVAILLPRHAVHARGCLSLEVEVAGLEQFRCHVLEQSGKSCFPIPAGCLPYAPQPGRRGFPALCPVRGLR